MHAKIQTSNNNKGKCHKNTINSSAELAELHRNAKIVSNGCCVVVSLARDCCMRVSVHVCECVCVCRLLNFDELTAIINLLASHFMPVNNDLCVCACLSMWENVTVCVCVQNLQQF